MNDLTKKLLRDYQPELALIVYAAGEKYNTDYYIESHVIDAAGQLQEGRPLKMETIAGMVKLFQSQAQEQAMISGEIWPCLLHYRAAASGDYRLIWHRPACRQTLYFHKDLNLPSGAAMVPPMLFVANSKRLDVYALDSDARPTPDSVIYHAPFHNVSNGVVCLGSAKAKAPASRSFNDLIRYWEDMFWNSEFSHINGDNPIEGNINVLWPEQVNSPERLFPLEVLKPIKNLSFANLFARQ